MYFSNKFLRILETLANEVESKTINGQDKLSPSVTAWCNYLNLPEEFSAEVVENFRRQELNDIFNTFLGEWGVSSAPLRYQKNPDVSIFISKIEDELPKQNSFKTKFYLLAAFVLVSSAYTFKRLSQLEEGGRLPQKLLTENSISKTKSFSREVGDSLREILVLVVNCKHKKIVFDLLGDSPFTTKRSEELYQVTQALWAGTEQAYEGLPIQNFFEAESEKSELKDSEYDVYFIKISLSELDNGFKKDASRLSRLDAFMRLPEIAEEIEISDRLSSKAYANIGVYSR